MTPTKNQLMAANSPYQGDFRKVLCICTAGVLRSPTIAHVLNSFYGFNTRAVGADPLWALIPVTPLLLTWADEIVFSDMEAREMCLKHHELPEGKPVKVLGINDDYNYMDVGLQRLIKLRYWGEKENG